MFDKRMHSRCLGLLVVTLVLLLAGCKREKTRFTETLASPDGKIKITITTDKTDPADTTGRLHYSVTLGGKTVLAPSPLGLQLAGPDGNLAKELILTEVAEGKIDEWYTMPAGKRSQLHNQANEKTLHLRNGQEKTVQLTFRAYNDGIAFRYELPGLEADTVLREYTGFRVPGDFESWGHKYLKTYENYYQRYTADSLRNTDMGFPVLFRTPEDAWMLLTEAAVFSNFGGTHLRGDTTGQLQQVAFVEATIPGKRPWTLPWRVAMIGDNPGTIVESSLVDHVNPPAALDTADWVKPGVSVFPWWSDHYANSSEPTLRKFVDAAAELGWDWIEFDVALVGSPDHAVSAWDTTAWIKGFVEYATQKKVLVYGWDEYKNLDTPAKRDYLYGRYRELGIRGIKIDFIDSDSLKAMQFRDAALRDAARYRLMVSFHGETLPRGQRRTYPHLMTHEAVKGGEYYTFTKTALPDYPRHNSILPFTRNVVGPMDYTPVAFSTPYRVTTTAHELAQAVVFESGWQVLCDKPDAYLNSPARPYLQGLPAAWDDIKFLTGRPGEAVCLARRKGNDWYVAALNGSGEKVLDVPLDFLGPGQYAVTLYEDGPDGKAMNVRQVTLKAGDRLGVKMAANGGFATVFRNGYGEEK